MVHSPKRISHTTNIKLEPYSVVSDTSTVPTDYASVASNESFYDISRFLDGRPVFGPWPKPALPIRSHSESDQIHKLTQCAKHDMKKSSSDTTMDIAIHCEEPLEEVNRTKINIPVAGNYDVAKQKLLENNLHEKSAATMRYEHANFDTSMDGTKHSIQIITPMVSSSEQNKLRFEQFQQRFTTLATPILGKTIETHESSTDEGLEINDTNNTKKPIGTLQSAPQSIKSKGIYDEIEINDKLATHNSSYFQQKRVMDFPPTASISSMAMKTQKLIDEAYRTTLDRENMHLLTDTVEKQCSENNNNNSNDGNLMNKCANELIFGIGKILRKESGGIAALYKHALERPDSRFSKILYSMIA